MTTGIRLAGLRKDFGATAAVDGIDLEVPAGAFLVLLGPSGCGKTTTLRMLAGLEHPTGGEIRFGDRVVAGPGVALAPGRRDAGLVFQSYALWPHMTVRGNVEWPLTVARTPAARRRERVAEVLELLAIERLAGRYPGEISGGQQQRVAIARMIAPRPSVLLFDEPLSNLDAKLRVETRAELLRIHRATGATSVYVTHDQVEAMTMATHVALMRDGRVEQFGPPADLLDDPASDFVATFMGTPAANVLDAVVRGGRVEHGGPGDGTDLGPAGGLADGTAVRAMYRPESLWLTSAGAGGPVLRVAFAEATPMAGRVVVTGVVGDPARRVRVSVLEDRRPAAEPGDALLVALPERPDRLFDAATGRRVDLVRAA
ncbi:ABC transporter ATP-binding protein [Pseudonocardia kunmingensis]|uniref:Carbohydrate ABC transporter ATP-binding protein (CUT1 family) n=1 Tax=Pseudonocardia kunmingensis TaxID=630975 RepID=A0A543E021_9PSEU|nr:ABC transporter ATP-binding protein [Pseudonocardia kunmingensis]TQM14839.1 carbohydrate ABC transporter ATP-binding protein (CUT1 family) [Pseudonocardia kunmingensis]